MGPKGQMGPMNGMRDKRMVVCAAVHGILTRQTRASWPDEFDAWMYRNDPKIHVIKKEYSAGPFPRLNWIKNRRLARGLAEELELFTGAEIWIVAHSNGAVIALMTLALLAKRGVKVAGIILTGAACESDVNRNGVYDLVYANRMLGRAIAFSSKQDGVVNCDGILGWLKYPYGDLGRSGWMMAGSSWCAREIDTFWFEGGHSIYFATGQINDTFERIHEEIRKGSNF